MFKEISLADIQKDPYHLIDHDWMLVTAMKKDGSINTMTASWGTIGSLWEKPVAIIWVRPQRYTKEFVDESDKVTLSFYPWEDHRMLGYMGTHSGRDEDKIEKCGLTTVNDDGYVYFQQANLVLFGHKLYQQDVQEACFKDETVLNDVYPKRDLHTMYIYEIKKVIAR